MLFIKITYILEEWEVGLGISRPLEHSHRYKSINLYLYESLYQTK